MNKPLRVLVACEASGIVRTCFERKGCDAWSCDYYHTELPGNHIRGDVLKLLNDGWDLMIAHPPCTHLAVSGAAWFSGKQKEQEEALQFFCQLLNAPIPQICVENPVCVASTRICKPTQIIQPYQFGHGSKKSTCLWLIGLPPLKPTNVVRPQLKKGGDKMYSYDHDYYGRASGSRNRARSRAVTHMGIAEAMANQWADCREYSYRSRKGIRESMGYVVKSKL